MNRTPTARTALAVLAAVVVAIAGLSACGDDGSKADGGGLLTISKPWARTSAGSATNGAVYLSLLSSGGDTLVRASVPAAVAAKVELHKTEMAGTGTATTMPGMASGELTMTPISELALPKGSQVDLAPGGYHLMLIGLVKPLTSGSTVSLTLTFAKAGDRTIEVPVRDDAP